MAAADRRLPRLFAAALPAWRQARRARRRHQDHRPRDLRRRLAFRRPRRDHPPDQVHRRTSTALRRLRRREQVVGLVVGLPLNMDGSDSPRTQSVRAFARNLAPLGLPILLWDERWSTQAVERAMIDADVSRAKRAEKVDALAAAHILQGAIDALANLGRECLFGRDRSGVGCRRLAASRRNGGGLP